jgi:hypothetical protein
MVRNRDTMLDRCPAARAAPPCGNRPVAAHLAVVDAATGAVISTVDSGNDGQFRIALQPGQYMLRPESVAGASPHAS